MKLLVLMCEEWMICMFCLCSFCRVGIMCVGIELLLVLVWMIVLVLVWVRVL